MDNRLSDLNAFQFRSYGGEGRIDSGDPNLSKTHFGNFADWQRRGIIPTFLALTNRKVVREKKLRWIIPRSLFIRNGLHTDLEATVWTYELRVFGGEQ